MTNSKHDHIFELMLIGDSAVGKSSLLSRFVDDIYKEIDHDLSYIDFKTGTVSLNGESIKLLFWDATGNKRMHGILSRYYRRVHGIVVVYDVTDRKSFENVKEWLQLINTHAIEDVNKLVVGNKCDLTTKRVVDYTEAKEYADSLNIPFFETSAKTPTNVEEVFKAMITNIKSRVSRVQVDPPNKPSSNVNRNGLFSRISDMCKSVAPTSTVNRQRTDGNYSPHIQCSKHAALTAEHVNDAQCVLDDKIDVFDRLSTSAKERVNVEHNRIITQANTDRDQAHAQIDQLIAEHKQHKH